MHFDPLCYGKSMELTQLKNAPYSPRSGPKIFTNVGARAAGWLHPNLLVHSAPPMPWEQQSGTSFFFFKSPEKVRIPPPSLPCSDPSPPLLPSSTVTVLGGRKGVSLELLSPRKWQWWQMTGSPAHTCTRADIEGMPGGTCVPTAIPLGKI